MLLRDFRNFIAVAETRSLSRAALRAHIAQPALSRQIHDLERELGVSLLERHSKGVTPTAAGQAFARGAANLLVTLGFAIERAEATSTGRRGRVSIGAMLTIIAAGIPAAVEERLRQEDPEITLMVEDLDPPDTVEQVRAGAIDIALTMAAEDDPDLISEPLWDEYLDHIILPHGHPLTNRRRLKLADLGDYPLIIPQRALAPGVLDDVMAVLRKGGLRSPLLVIDVGLRDGHLAVSSGRGWSLIGRARAVSPPQGTAVVALADAAPKVRAAALWRRDDKRPVLRRVLQSILDAVRDHPHACLRREPHLPPLPQARKASKAPLGSIPALMEIRHLRALLAVAAAQTIGRAAERLGVTQPALSRQLKELEHAIGLPLLERTARGVHLTPAGNSLASECPGILAGLDQIVLDTTRARRGMEGRCVIGAVATLTTGEMLTRVLTDVAKRHPHVHVVIEEVTTPLQAPAIVRGDIDVGLAHAHPGVTYPGLVVEQVHEDRLQMALLPAGHPLARRKLKPADLNDFPFLFPDRAFQPAFYDRVFDALHDAGVIPRVDGTHDGLQAIWALVARGKGWALGFKSHRRRPPGGTVAVPLVGFDLPWGLNLLRRRGEPSVALRCVLEAFRRVGGPGRKNGAGSSPAARPVRRRRVRADS